jgi:signal transduction histidine kinase/AmiR/NasT family two-component response regulator
VAGIERGNIISLAFLISLAVLAGVAAAVALRLRRGSPAGRRVPASQAPEAGTAEPQTPAMTPPSNDELARAQAALIDSQIALATARAECAQAREDAALARRQRHAFLAGLAHDLRNPLAPLSNGIELLRLTDGDPAGRLRTRGILERQVGNLMRIADELSDLARLTGGHASLQRQTYVFADMLHAAADRARPAAQAQQMMIEVAAEPGLVLEGDAQRLAEAFGHLLSDLVRHSERGAGLRLEATPVAAGIEVVVGAAADLAAFAAPDAPPLEPADAPTLGLGIALCDQLLALHHGGLRAERPAGVRRARFTATLPVAQAATEAPAAVATNVVSMSPEPPLAVLLADDNVDFSHSFATMLELLGHHVEVVHDGLAAVATIVGAPPDIAFIDIGMPSLDGFDAVQRVRGQVHTQDVMLVAVTGRGGAEDRARAAECGFDRYLVKPIAMQDVRDALDAAQAMRNRALARGVGAFAAARAVA